MKKALLITTVVLLFIINCSSQTINLCFEVNNSTLKSFQKNILYNNIPEGSNVKLFGYSDTIGSKDYNKKLAQKRIDAVKNTLLVSHKDVKISFQNYGEDSSKFSIDSLNRRVEIVIETQSIVNKLEPDTQLFYIDNSKDTILIGPKGTKIRIPKNSFYKEMASNCELEVRLLEFYNKSDMLLANLTTTSDDRILTTGGMINIEVFDHKKKCELQNGSSLEVLFNKRKANDSMQVFYGEQNSDYINWKLSENNKRIEDTVEYASFVIVEQSASFMGGDINDFRLFAQSRLPYFSSLDNYSSKTVIIQFAVNRLGDVEDVLVLRGINPGIDSIAANVVKKSPKWVPGRQSNKPVKQQFVIPLIFDKASKNTLAKYSDTTYLKSYIDSINKTEVVNQQLRTSMYMNVNKLGWINCDRFAYYPNLIPIKFKYADKSELVYVVFNKLKSIASLNVISKFPRNEEVIFISLRKDGANYIFGQQSTIISYQPVNMSYETISYTELQEKLKELNK